jgi:hypothetical protein
VQAEQQRRVRRVLLREQAKQTECRLRDGVEPSMYATFCPPQWDDSRYCVLCRWTVSADGSTPSSANKDDTSRFSNSATSGVRGR